MYSPSSHIWCGYLFLCQKPPSDVRGWSRICWRSRSMAKRNFSRPVFRYSMKRGLPALMRSMLYSSAR